MILSTVALADPGFNRFIGYVYPADPKTPLLNFLYIFIRQHPARRLDARMGSGARPAHPLPRHRFYLSARVHVHPRGALLLEALAGPHPPVGHRLGKVVKNSIEGIRAEQAQVGPIPFHQN
jgi:hypothetical protein